MNVWKELSRFGISHDLVQSQVRLYLELGHLDLAAKLCSGLNEILASVPHDAGKIDSTKSSEE